MSSTFLTAAARAVAAERKWRGISQEELGRRLNLSDSTISAIESGDRRINVDELPELCAALGCTVWDLIRRANSTDRAMLGVDESGRPLPRSEDA